MLVIPSSMYSSLTRGISFSRILNFLEWLDFQLISYRSANGTQHVHSWNQAQVSSTWPATFIPLLPAPYFMFKFIANQISTGQVERIFDLPLSAVWKLLWSPRNENGCPSGLSFDLLVPIVLCFSLNSWDRGRVICSTHVFLLVVGNWFENFTWIFFVFNNWCLWRYYIVIRRRVSAAVTPNSPSRPTKLSSR